MKHFFYTEKCIIYDIFLSFTTLDISYERLDWFLEEYDGKFFPGEITHIINNQCQM